MKLLSGRHQNNNALTQWVLLWWNNPTRMDLITRRHFSSLWHTFVFHCCDTCYTLCTIRYLRVRLSRLSRKTHPHRTDASTRLTSVSWLAHSLIVQAADVRYLGFPLTPWDRGLARAAHDRYLEFLLTSLFRDAGTRYLLF